MKKKIEYAAEVIDQLLQLRAKCKSCFSGRRRFWMHKYLTGVYRVYRKWRAAGDANRRAREASARLNLDLRKNTHPLRVIIEATCLDPDLKKKSRWTRALEYAHVEKIKPKKLVRFFEAHGGISGCAGAASELNPKRRIRKSDWD